LDKFKACETSIIQSVTSVWNTVTDCSNAGSTSAEKHTVRITRDHLEAGKRVLSITDVAGVSPDQSIMVLTADLSPLESKMPANTGSTVPVKTFAEDAENDVPEPPPSNQPPRSIFGVIKVFMANVQNCTVIIKCMIITGTVELHNCQNVVLQVEKEATVATVQADVSENITIEFRDAVSGKHVPGQKPALDWGDDRISHAGVFNMTVRIYREGYLDTETTADFEKDGAEQIGNATPKEFQFVTSCHEGSLVTESVVRAGNTTGKNVRAMTQRELQIEKERGNVRPSAPLKWPKIWSKSKTRMAMSWLANRNPAHPTHGSRYRCTAGGSCGRNLYLHGQGGDSTRH
jgi:hypothetical protein